MPTPTFSIRSNTWSRVWLCFVIRCEVIDTVVRIVTALPSKWSIPIHCAQRPTGITLREHERPRARHRAARGAARRHRSLSTDRPRRAGQRRGFARRAGRARGRSRARSRDRGDRRAARRAAAGWSTSAPAPPAGSRSSTPPSAVRRSASPTAGSWRSSPAARARTPWRRRRRRTTASKAPRTSPPPGSARRTQSSRSRRAARTPYALGAARAAAEAGALTVAVVCSRDSKLGLLADHEVVAVAGPEVIAGSTRMKAGTAQKLVLNTISTVTMVRLGRTFGNLMVDVVASNAKLRARARRVVELATDVSDCGGRRGAAGSRRRREGRDRLPARPDPRSTRARAARRTPAARSAAHWGRSA